ncbi:MAG: LCP family protein [Acidimicrobiales bacterium]
MPDNRPSSHDRYDRLRDLQRRPKTGRPAHRRSRAARRETWAAPAGSTDRSPGPDRAPGAARPAAQRLASLQVPRRRRWPRRLLVGLNVAIAVALVGGLSAFGYAVYRLGQVNRISVPGLAAARSGPFTVLIVGSDTRSLHGSGNAQFGTQAQTPGQRSDTIMLARVVPAQRRITLMSIPRDLWVDIPGWGSMKINAAFDTGPALLIKTIRQDLGIPINHFIEVNFDSFRQITDAVGGVKVWFPTPARDPYSLLSVSHAGCVLLKGNQALAFARSRHYTYLAGGQWVEQGLSDLARIQREQLFVKKMLKKAESRFTNPVALNGIIAGITRNLTVDSGFSATTMLGLAEDFRTADLSGIPTETLPVNNYYVDFQDALALQQPQANEMIHAFNTEGDGPASAASSTAGPTTATSTAAPAGPVAVEVANGSGVTGQAAAASAALSKVGYRTTVQPQSPGYGHASTEILYAPDSRTAAVRLQSRLQGAATLVASAALTPTPYNLELITGADWAGVGPPNAVMRSAPSKPAPSQVRVTNYPLPGPAPTQAALDSCQ